MNDIRKVLVPVDFSAASGKALDSGILLAKEFNATLIVAHVIEFLHPVAYAFPDEAFENVKRKADEVRQKLKELIPDSDRDSLDYRLVVKTGNVEDELLAAMQDEPVDLVVMGTHGRRGFKRWMLGSTTEHLLRNVPVPVLTVSHVEDENTPASLPQGRILYATDLSDGMGKGLDIAYKWAERFAAELTVLHVMLPLRLEYGATYLPMDIGKDHAALHAELAGQLDRAIPEPMRRDPRVRCEVGDGVPWEVILKYAEDKGMGLVVIHLHGKGRQERNLLGSTAERVVRASRIPVLAIPTPDKPV